MVAARHFDYSFLFGGGMGTYRDVSHNQDNYFASEVRNPDSNSKCVKRLRSPYLLVGNSKVDFFRLDNLPIGVKKEIVPQVRSAEMDKRSILGVLRDAWNEKGKAENTILPN